MHESARQEDAKDEETLEDADGSRRTPVTILTGALGAGKTTLLKYVLEKPHGFRVAVIQNEFSEEMGMESPLITDAAGDTFKDIVELPNGCLCCSAKDGLITALDRLLEDRRRFDYVLVEATGVADPEAICEIFWVDDELGSKVYLDGVVTLVDSRNCLSALGADAEDAADGSRGEAADLGLEAETAKQVACADVLVLNKVDLAPAAKRARVSSHVSTMNPTAVVLESTYAQVPLRAILGIRAFDEKRLAATLAQLAIPGHSNQEYGHFEDSSGHGNIHGQAHGHAHDHGHGHAHGHGPVDGQDDQEVSQTFPSQDAGEPPVNHGIESIFLRCTPPGCAYDPSKIRTWLADVLWEGVAGGVYRCKGIFRGSEAGHAVQGVGKLFEIEEVDCTMGTSKFLFIGRRLRRDALERGLRGCLASP